MARLTILEFPDPRLRTRARPVGTVDDSVRALAADMFETMYAAPGIGLAATQVDRHVRLIVIDITDDRSNPIVLIDPELTNLVGEQEQSEGCLSVPGYYEPVLRAETVLVRATNLDGERFELQADGLLAQCIQHECDHLDGKLFVDHISPFKRQRIRQKLEKQHRARA
jgi:peptide deformylase